MNVRSINAMLKRNDSAIVAVRPGAQWLDSDSGEVSQLPNAEVRVAGVVLTADPPDDISSAQGLSKRRAIVYLAAIDSTGAAFVPTLGMQITTLGQTWTLNAITPLTQRGVPLVYDARAVA